MQREIATQQGSEIRVALKRTVRIMLMAERSFCAFGKGQDYISTSQKWFFGTQEKRREEQFWKRESDFRTRASEVVLGTLLLSPPSQCQPHPSISVKSSSLRTINYLLSLPRGPKFKQTY